MGIFLFVLVWCWGETQSLVHARQEPYHCALASVLLKIPDGSVLLSWLNLFFILDELSKWETKSRVENDLAQSHTVTRTRAGTGGPEAFQGNFVQARKRHPPLGRPRSKGFGTRAGFPPPLSPLGWRMLVQ